MIHVKNDKGFIIEHKFLFAFTEPNPKYINLASTLGEDMRYHKLKYDLIDYPGEYDIQGMGIQCFLGKDGNLNYLINITGKKIGLIQSEDVLEIDEVGDVAFWLYTNDKIANKIDQLELEGSKQKLEDVVAE